MATYHGMTELDRLRGFIQDKDNYAEIEVDLDILVDQNNDVELDAEGGRRRNPPWYADVDIRPDPGWYFFKTNAPYTVFAGLPPWATHAPNARGVMVPVRNYDLQNRANQYHPMIAGLLAGDCVYSGYTQKLRARYRDHILPNPQTGALALARYPVLQQYKWSFHYAYLDQFMVACPRPSLVLNLGEQIWRAHVGWPILCKQ